MKKLIIGPGRLSFPFLFTQQPAEYGGKYACTLLLPPTLDTSLIAKALLDAATEKWGADKKKWPKGVSVDNVIRKAEDKSHLTGYEAGWKFVSLKSKQQPSIVDGTLSPVTDEKQVYPGRWARVSASAYAYDNVLKGVGLGLHNIQLLQHDTPFSGSGNAKNDFDIIAEDLGSEELVA